MKSKPLSLKARAIALLAQREHSVAELRRKLLRIESLRLRHEVTPNVDEDDPGPADADSPPAIAEAVDALLLCLQSQGYLDEQRFVESRVNARSRRWGTTRIKQELAQHGLSLSPDYLNELKASEFDRAMEVWRRKFGSRLSGPDETATRPAKFNNSAEQLSERVKHTRFLVQRGFSPELVNQVLRQVQARAKDEAVEPAARSSPTHGGLAGLHA
ncbi:regulatory protein RecX [Roseateles koreensis]|uniref:Regulatory protein RecX n=1 Tax=Roseateles koreensis TaxID=2987526 RepID=A0ABT5KRV6_9BURK|nr:regulatory protein RecX [Roseateles koreensis]MDC8785643.1 regulatory protein RecX [Roseateles koreensis]